MKQTAVEWLQQALEDTILTHEQIMQTIGLFEQAKEMEQEQIVNAYQAGDGDAYNLEETKDFGEQYFTETYGGNK